MKTWTEFFLNIAKILWIQQIQWLWSTTAALILLNLKILYVTCVCGPKILTEQKKNTITPVITECSSCSVFVQQFLFVKHFKTNCIFKYLVESKKKYRIRTISIKVAVSIMFCSPIQQQHTNNKFWLNCENKQSEHLPNPFLCVQCLVFHIVMRQWSLHSFEYKGNQSG